MTADFIFNSQVIRARSSVFQERRIQEDFLQALVLLRIAEVTVVSQFDGNLIVNVKDSRVAVNKEKWPDTLWCDRTERQ